MQEYGLVVAACFARLGREVIEGDRAEFVNYNWPALDCIHNRDSTLDHRNEVLVRWLDHYKVLMGFTHEQRSAIGSAVLAWADRRDLNQPPITAEEINAAHGDLVKTCRATYQHERGFASLASKALWLCYPEYVPIFDDFAKSSVQVLIQFEPGIVAARSGADDYEKYVHYWKQLFNRYSSVLDAELAKSGNERVPKVKVFDAVLWMLGRPGFNLPKVGLEEPQLK